MAHGRVWWSHTTSYDCCDPRVEVSRKTLRIDPFVGFVHVMPNRACFLSHIVRTKYRTRSKKKVSCSYWSAREISRVLMKIEQGEGKRVYTKMPGNFGFSFVSNSVWTRERFKNSTRVLPLFSTLRAVDTAKMHILWRRAKPLRPTSIDIFQSAFNNPRTDSQNHHPWSQSN